MLGLIALQRELKQVHRWFKIFKFYCKMLLLDTTFLANVNLL